MSNAAAVRAPLNWPAVIMFVITTVPAVTIFPLYAWKVGFDAFEWTWFFILWALNGLAITTGYHRLWAHRSYEAAKPLQIFWMLFGAMALQNSILIWASMHRVHHRNVDDVDLDPYSAKRGLWFSHIGWMLRTYPSGHYNFSNARDLENNPIVMFQHRHYLALALAMNIGVALSLGLWNGDIWGALLLPGLMRLVVSHHCTFFINSLAHYWGKRPYTTENTARDNGFLALFTYGEGYHNFHHLFQWDYRNGVRWWQYDPTKWLIALFSAVGLARNLKRVPEFQIRKALVERQLQQAQEELGAVRDGTRVAVLQAALERELQHYKETVARWATLQQERVQSAKQKLMDDLSQTDAARRARELEEALRQQYRRLRSMTQTA